MLWLKVLDMWQMKVFYFFVKIPPGVVQTVLPFFSLYVLGWDMERDIFFSKLLSEFESASNI